MAEADTQPLEEKPDGQEEEEVERGGVWGWLVPLPYSHLDPNLVSLKESKVTVGREADVVIDESLFEGNDENRKWLKVSRVHFEVRREHGRAELLDKSSNGTFINEVRVGKEKPSRLAHLDEIGVLECDFALYYYIDEGLLKLQLDEDLRSKYLVGRLLGKGASASVKEVFTRVGHERRAIKIIDKEGEQYSESEDLMREVDVLKGIKHPCIAEIVEVVETERNVSIIMEYAAGGDLFEQVSEDNDSGKLVEHNAKIQFYQIAHAIAFLHSKNICHRDLKLENILLAKSGPTSRIKVTDFGLSKKWSSTSLLKTFVGTPTYMAPEVIRGAGQPSWDMVPYSCKSDCWSLGVILYILLSGQQPFVRNRSSMDNLKKSVMAGAFTMKGSRWEKVSEEGKELVTKLLQVDPDKRLSAKEILEASWFTGDTETVNSALEVIGLDELDSIPSEEELDREDSGVGHSGGSTSTPSDARGTLNHSGDSGAGTAGQDVDSASEEDSVPRRVLGKRRGEQPASGDRSEKKAGDGAGVPIYATGMALRPRVRRSRGLTEVKKRAAGQSK